MLPRWGLIYANTNKVDHVSQERYLRVYNLKSLIELTLQNRMPQGVDLNFITPANIELLRDEINRAIDEYDSFTVKPIEEDSPGNFTITVRDDIVHLSVYDFNGKEITILPARADE